MNLRVFTAFPVMEVMIVDDDLFPSNDHQEVCG